jgi:hypothetical protein
VWFCSDLRNNAHLAFSTRISGVNFWPFQANEVSLKEGQVMDPAEEVLLDPALVNPNFLFASKDSYSCANRLFVSSGGVAPSVFEVNAYERDDNRARTLTRRMRELDKLRLANCDQSGRAVREGDFGAIDWPARAAKIKNG